MARPKKAATCHPDRPHWGQGYCRSCYRKAYRKRPGNKHWQWQKEKRGRGQSVWLLRRNYGLTPAARQDILVKQQGRCPVCTQPLTLMEAVIDHNHACCPGVKTCGKCIRGLLHRKCNRALGMLGDDPVTLQRAAAYLDSRLPHS